MIDCKFYTDLLVTDKKKAIKCKDLPYFTLGEPSSFSDDYNCSQEGNVCFKCIKQYWRNKYGEDYIKNTCKECKNRLKCITK